MFLFARTGNHNGLYYKLGKMQTVCLIYVDIEKKFKVWELKAFSRLELHYMLALKQTFIAFLSYVLVRPCQALPGRYHKYMK